MEGFVNLSAGLKSGVYLLEYRSVVVYVGRSVKVFARLANHMSAHRRNKLAKQGSVKGILFDRVWFRACGLAELDAMEKALIERFNPRYNLAVKPGGRRLEIKLGNKVYVLNPNGHQPEALKRL